MYNLFNPDLVGNVILRVHWKRVSARVPQVHFWFSSPSEALSHRCRPPQAELCGKLETEGRSVPRC